VANEKEQISFFSFCIIKKAETNFSGREGNDFSWDRGVQIIPSIIETIFLSLPRVSIPLERISVPLNKSSDCGRKQIAFAALVV
jgi:hypothetical protein